MGALSRPIDRGEVLQHYFWQRGVIDGDCGQPGPKILDEIAQSTVARLNVAEFKRMANQKWMEKAKSTLVDGTFELKTAEETALIPEIRVRVSEDLKAMKSKLRRIGLLRKRRRGELESVPCGAFLVLKKNGKHRVVLDARPANRITKKIEEFALFTLEDLVHSFAALMQQHGRCFAHTLDFKHFFYQLPLKDRMQFLFDIAGDRPTVFPMGFHSSPSVGQTVSWTAVLFREEEESELGIPHQDTNMPPFVTISDEAGVAVAHIFVLLDNILILADSEIRLKNLRERIYRNIANLNLEVKNEEVSNALIGAELIKLEGYQSTFTFAGVEFSVEGWRSISGGSVKAFPPTRRGALMQCGVALWEIRVRRLHLRAFPRLRELYRTVAAASGSWNDNFEIPEAIRLELAAIEVLRQSRDWTFECPPPPPERIRLAATDATPWSVAWVYLGDKIPIVGAQMLETKEDAAWAELKAVVLLAREVRNSLAGRIELRVLTDSAITAAVVEKGYSASTDLDELLQELAAIQTEGAGMAIRTRWISGSYNVADTPSRRVTNRRCRKCTGWRRRDTEGACENQCLCQRPQWEDEDEHEDSCSDPSMLSAERLSRCLERAKTFV